MIWNKSKECMSRDEMSDLQGKRLHKLVELVYHNVPFYREKMQALDLTPEDIRSIEDIRKLPFTTKQDLRDNYPTGLQAASQSEIVRVHASSGTTGNPTIVGYTRRDLEIWRECSARAFTSYGVTRDDVFSVGYGYGLFTGGLGAHYGVEYVGATVIPTSTGNTDKHLRLLRDLRITGIACTPSYALYLAEAMERNGMTRKDICLRVGAFGAEPWTENMREEIEARLGLQAYNLYGLSEIIGPGVSYECPCKNGSHISEDHFYPEIIDPETLEPQPFDAVAVGGRRRRWWRGAKRSDQDRHAAAALPYQGSLLADRRDVRLRKNQRPDDADHRPQRRHAHHPGNQRLPLAGRERHPRDARIRTHLHAGRRPHQQPRHAAGAGRGAQGLFQRRARSDAPAAQAPRRQAQERALDQRRRPAHGAQLDSALRGQERAGHRQTTTKMIGL